jgi:hypothetical protein
VPTLSGCARNEHHAMRDLWLIPFCQPLPDKHLTAGNKEPVIIGAIDGPCLPLLR